MPSFSAASAATSVGRSATATMPSAAVAPSVSAAALGFFEADGNRRGHARDLRARGSDRSPESLRSRAAAPLRRRSASDNRWSQRSAEFAPCIQGNQAKASKVEGGHARSTQYPRPGPGQHDRPLRRGDCLRHPFIPSASRLAARNRAKEALCRALPPGWRCCGISGR